MIFGIPRASLSWPLPPFTKKSVLSCASALDAIAICGGLTAVVVVGYYSMRQEISWVQQNGEDLWFSLQGLETLLKTLIDL
jgi:hypothetical protein